jgi:hypothetical protein
MNRRGDGPVEVFFWLPPCFAIEIASGGAGGTCIFPAV